MVLGFIDKALTANLEMRREGSFTEAWIHRVKTKYKLGTLGYRCPVLYTHKITGNLGEGS